MTNQQPLAYIHPEARLAGGVTVDPFASIYEDVERGEGTHIMGNAVILPGSRIGKNCTVFPGAVIGAIPQDLKFRGEKTYVYIGDNTVIRECATVHRGTAARGKTVIGNNCLIMAYCHVAHDCVLGNNIIMSNATQLAGEVDIDDYAVIGGGTLVHQFSRIGCHSMIQGGTKVNKDVPPYAIAAREPIAFAGINVVGLRRRGFSEEQVETVQGVYRMLFNSGLNNSDAMEKIVAEMPQTAERDTVVEFVKSSPRGILKGNAK